MIDILLAVYNGEKYLQEQLDSITSQTYKDWHLIIRDDGSKDKSVEIAKSFAQNYPGKVEVHINKIPTGSASRNFMKMVNDADAEYVMFCDQDDVWLSDKIEKTFKVMRACERRCGREIPILVHSDLCVVDENLRGISASMRRYQKLPKSTEIHQLLIQNSVTGCTMMINRTLLEMMHQVADSSAVVMHDYWAALVASVFGKIVFIRQPLIKYRQHGDNSVGALNAVSFKYLYMRFKAGKDQFRQRLLDTMKQTDAFNRVYAEKLQANPQKTLLEKYANLTNSHKFKKIHFYLSNHVWKYGIIRKIMQIVWS